MTNNFAWVLIVVGLIGVFVIAYRILRAGVYILNKDVQGAKNEVKKTNNVFGIWGFYIIIMVCFVGAAGLVGHFFGKAGAITFCILSMIVLWHVDKRLAK